MVKLKNKHKSINTLFMMHNNDPNSHWKSAVNLCQTV